MQLYEIRTTEYFNGYFTIEIDLLLCLYLIDTVIVNALVLVYTQDIGFTEVDSLI